MSWQLALSLEASSSEPVFVRIARAVAEDVRRGRLKPGAALPGSRALAEALGVHRNTVIAAYRELMAEGWIDASEGKGTFVSATLPDAPKPKRFSREAPPRAKVPEKMGFDPASAHEPTALVRPPPGTFMLTGGVPDVRLFPKLAHARAYRRALRDTAALDYGDPRGDHKLRAAIAAMLSMVRGLAASADDLIITRGSQMAMDLTARALLAPGDVMAVESYGYRPAWEAFKAAGARLVPIPVDDYGIDVAALAALTERERVRAVYVTPHHQYPTTMVLSAGRRMELLSLAKRARMAVLEDDYDHEFHYDGRPVLPLASVDEDGVVVYFGTLSKILAPGLRIGFVVAPRPFIEKLAVIRTFVDRQGDLVVERAVAELFEEGEAERAAQRAKRAYKARRDALVEALSKQLSGVLDFRVPAGGMAVWAKAEGVDVDAWAERALAHKVAFTTGKRFAFDGKKRPYVRLGFAASTEDELHEAVKRMARAL